MKQHDILVIGDNHYIGSREQAIKSAEESILKTIKGKKFKRVVFLGDLFDKKPTAKERAMLAAFINKLRNHTDHFDFIIGNGKHTFEAGHIHEEDWMLLCKDFHQHEEMEIGNFIFGHYEIKGTRYINGTLSESRREADKDKVYILGHIHQPECSFDNVNYVGSMYKTAFDQMDDTKRIAIIDGEELSWLPIESLPMYTVTMTGKKGKVSVKGLKAVEGDVIDLKVKVETDSISLNQIHKRIAKIKEEHTIEYYRQEIKVLDAVLDVPKDLDQKTLLKNYCKQVGVNHALVNKEMS